MIEKVLFHHHSSIYNEDWSKPGFGNHIPKFTVKNEYHPPW